MQFLIHVFLPDHYFYLWGVSALRISLTFTFVNIITIPCLHFTSLFLYTFKEYFCRTMLIAFEVLCILPNIIM